MPPISSLTAAIASRLQQQQRSMQKQPSERSQTPSLIHQDIQIGIPSKSLQPGPFATRKVLVINPGAPGGDTIKFSAQEQINVSEHQQRFGQYLKRSAMTLT